MSGKKEHLMEEYGDLVWKVVRMYPVKTEADNKDAFQAGCLGLCEAYNRFNKSKSCQFTTYAFPWIQKYVREFARKNSFYADIPPNQMALAQKTHKAFATFRSERVSKVEAIRKTAAFLDKSVDDVKAALAVYMSHQDHSTYLDDPDCTESLDQEVDVVEAVSVKRQTDRLRKIALAFPKREREILDTLYFGDNIICDTVTEAGRLMGITKQSAQELHKKAISKLKQKASLEMQPT